MSDLVATVRSEHLTQSVAFVGTVDLGAAFTVTPSATGVVTRVAVRRGESVSSGDVLITINDNPVIALRGRVPLWRDLAPGDTGPDVSRLQASLADAGHLTGDRDGVFGPGTEDAIRALYAHAGFPATAASPGLRADEIAMVPVLPARVALVGSRLGASDVGTVTLASRAPVVVARLDPLDAAKVRPGQRIQLQATSLGSFSGRVLSVAAPAADGDAGYTSLVTISPSRSLPMNTSGQQVAGTASTRARQATLVVPDSAIHARPDGSLYVVMARGHHHVAVAVSAEANGRSSVTALPGALKAGDDVLIGIR
ncbi:MAG TPA: peptidoglycan-binding protein [Galbitalea sp.]